MLTLLVAASGTALATGLGAIPVFLLGPRAAALRLLLLGIAAGAMSVASVAGLLLPGLDEGSAGSVGAVRDAVVGTYFESAVDVAVLAGNRLVGIVPIEALLAANRETGIETVMDSDPPVVAPGVDQEVVAWVMCRRGEASIAVVDSGGRFAGLIPPDRMLEVVRETQAGTAIESSSVHDHGRVPQRNRLCSGQLAQAETTP